MTLDSDICVSNIQITNIDNLIYIGNTPLIVKDDKGKYKDYHFYRQDNDGFWSHKQGKDKIKRFDASFDIIRDPRNADRNYSRDDKNKDKYNYEIFCGYFSVPHNGGPFYRN